MTQIETIYGKVEDELVKAFINENMENKRIMGLVEDWYNSKERKNHEGLIEWIDTAEKLNNIINK